MIPVSILILTKNEEKNITGCVNSVRWSDDIWVLDSISNDHTIEIAKTLGASVVQRQFDNWSSHQNWALKNIHFKYPWVFYIDADERVTAELQKYVSDAVLMPNNFVAFAIRRRDFYDARWLKHAQASPFYIRLFRPNRIHYERLVNPLSVIDGPVGNIAGYLDHYPFSKGIAHWIERHNSYSNFEAQEIIGATQRGDKISVSLALFGKDFHTRRVHQKRIFYKIPGRPFLKFFLLFFLKGGFLDGRQGLVYCILQSIYEYFIVLKVREISRRNANKDTKS